MANMVVANEQLRRVLLSAAELSATVVGSTGGPQGRTVAISKAYGAPEITKDGYKVMKSIKPEDPATAGIIAILGQSCSQCNDRVGDGTTTCCILTANMCIEAIKSIASGAQAAHVSLGMNKAAKKVLEVLSSTSRKVGAHEEIANVAKISANGDVNIGESIANCVKEVGREGVITVEESKGFKELEVERTNGMMFDRGYLSGYFVTNSEKMIAEYDDPLIMITDKKLSVIQPIVPLLEKVARSGRALLIIADDVEGEALTTLVLNRLRNSIKVVAVKAPGFGEKKKAMLEDIAIVTGTTVFSDDLGTDFENLNIGDLGNAKNIQVTKDSTTIVSEKGEDHPAIKQRIAQIKAQIESATSDYEKEKLRERLAKLAGGVAVLKVGGSTEVEVKERRDRVEDALHATRAAIEEGIVPGGGVALLYASIALETLSSDNDDERAGINIVKRALSAPIKKLVSNAAGEGAVVVDYLLGQKDRSLIFDVNAMNYVNAFQAGIIDPTKVVRIAFETAVSVARVLITTEAFLVDIPSKDDNAAAGGGMGGGGMGGMGGF